MSELPPNWVMTTIGRTSEINPPASKGIFADDEMVSFVPMKSVEEESGSLDASESRSYQDLKTKSYRQFQEGDLLIAKITPSMENGKAAVATGLVSGRGFGSTEFHVIRPKSGINPRYLLHFVLQPRFRADAARNMTGTAGQLRVPAEYLRNHPIPLPSSAEQQRIVTAIEEHLSRLVSAEASLDSACRRASLLRASLIEDLTRGEWDRRPLGDVLLSLRNGCFVSRPKVEAEGHPILRISAVRPLALDVSDVRYAPQSLPRVVEFQIQAGDVLFTRYSGTPDYVGACAVVPPEGVGLLHPDKLIRGIPDQSVVTGEWIALAVTAATGRREIELRLKTTAGQVGIAGSQLKTVTIPIPSLSEQAMRTSLWNGHLRTIIRMMAEVEAARRRSNAARRAILSAAFSGQLVPHDSTDAPASELLERLPLPNAVTPTIRKRQGKIL